MEERTEKQSDGKTFIVLEHDIFLCIEVTDINTACSAGILPENNPYDVSIYLKAI